MKRIILSVTNDLVTDQRVHRSCMALHEAGYDVTLVGRLLPESVPVERPYRTIRMRLFFRRKALFYAEYNIRLFIRLLFSRTDLFYANDTDVLVANYCASKLRKKPLFVDAHEMFPEMPELVGRPRIKAFWQKIEDCIYPHVEHCCTVCQSIADIYNKRYGVDMKVVRNVPMRSDSRRRGDNMRPPYTLLYQGAVNVGRGLEEILAAMPLLTDCRLLVAGEGDKFEEVRRMARDMGLGEDKVRFLGRLPLSELRSITMQADLGISLLKNLGLNYYYSLPNRIADFAQSGVPVLATDFPEIKAVIEKYGIGTLVPSGEEDNPQILAEHIRKALNYWQQIDLTERDFRFAKAGEELCWEHDKNILLSSIDAIFKNQ